MALREQGHPSTWIFHEVSESPKPKTQNPKFSSSLFLGKKQGFIEIYRLLLTIFVALMVGTKGKPRRWVWVVGAVIAVFIDVAMTSVRASKILFFGQSNKACNSTQSAVLEKLSQVVVKQLTQVVRLRRRNFQRRISLQACSFSSCHNQLMELNCRSSGREGDVPSL
ncbi:hypothetical protein C1H46_004185 [Malus baccata]|uniref:Uncharacterized protein n=1 Tax=Malus baccata TaxID=106549 RepID=A0A540NHZ5_MALBA|nr:hypothetical protein C1H46_004185 [Malus baccata]